MAPVRSSTRRGAHPTPTPPIQDADGDDPNTNKELFLDPMLGTPLAIYLEKEVEDKDNIAQLIIKHGGTVSPGYSGVPYILVDPHKPSGQNLWRQYAGKKGKIVLNAQWVHECIKTNQLQTFHSNWAGCKVTGTETYRLIFCLSIQVPARRTEETASAVAARSVQAQAIHPHALQAPMPPVDPLNAYPFQVYVPPPIPGAPPRTMPGQPPQTWQVTIAPSQTHLHPPPPPPPPMIHRAPAASAQAGPSQHYREDAWDGYSATDEMAPQPTSYEYRYRDEQNGWVPGPGPYYEPSYDHPYGQPPYMEDPPEHSSGANSVAGQPQIAAEKARGRKRTRAQPAPAAPAASLVVNRNPPARSPTPPTRVIKSTYGGNLFTADDVMYLKKYIDYCQDQCLVLSLREICERIAVKAPHHTFYSWRRYCNKHQIRLGGYAMNRSESPIGGDDLDLDMDGADDMVQRTGNAGQQHHNAAAGSSMSQAPAPSAAPTRLDMSAATAAAAAAPHRNRSPTPPRALYRSTTGKGVAFTQEDVTFLVRFMEYRKSQGVLDMVAFWKDVAVKAPHHSRASWMKFWRRHKHELARSDGDEPLPAPPDKKMRYSKEDDVLLAKYFFNKPDGTSDKIFQAFGRLHPHHPWKGWQEHHRIHKTKIEHLMQLLGAGEDLDAHDMDES
ncbi:hypothetical protein HYPSUDRAFT_142746 [Hypholoma sublateritium FD-334 SS-4]|uniref:BRCT domain-containing protein n=1 Tax=Hypholoma sublateritium (strain FD-334 SS-4) TaxID=945553 RepID=A0A0D2L021_HYPSF|nr:hypothetical protein HYPSUDRAFT_142746 [Hypholoma sublateritium FD-334 SS-4]